MSGDSFKQQDSFAQLFENAASPKRPRRFSIGDEVQGVIVNVGTDAVFIDIDGKREAFVERASLVHHDGTPMQLSVGDTLRATIAEFGGRGGAMRLEPVALRQQGGDVADEASVGGSHAGVSGATLTTGAHVSGLVVRTESYGVFVQVEGTSGRQGRGLVPAVETGCPRGTDFAKKFPVGTKVDVKILSIQDDGKIRMSMRALLVDEERATFDKYTGSQKKADDSQASKGFGTLASVFARSQIHTPKSKGR